VVPELPLVAESPASPPSAPPKSLLGVEQADTANTNIQKKPEISDVFIA
jgi:hypothetical protein